MTKLPSPDSIWIPPVLSSDRRGFWYRHRDADAASTEYLLATPARRAADELVKAAQYTIDTLYKGEEFDYDEDGDMIDPALMLREALRKAREES